MGETNRIVNKRTVSIYLLIIFLSMVGISGCKRTMHSVIQNDPKFVGIVESSTDDYILLKINEDDPMYADYSFIQVSRDVELKDSFLYLHPGDEIAVYYNGDILDGRADIVYAVFLRAPSWQKK